MNLTDLQHSVFLQALGGAILNSLWQGLLLWILYEATCISYKNASSRFKNNLSTILLFSSFTWFVVSLWLQLTSDSSLVSGITGAVVATGETHNVSAVENFLSKAAASLPYLSSAYILLLGYLSLKLLNAYRYVYLVSNKQLITPPEVLQNFTSRVSEELAITKKIRVWISKHIDVPATVGFIKPVILIPIASLNNLSGEQLEAIILHELSHIRRNDFIINILVSIVETILFFNPFVVLLSRAVKRERENCCDDFVLKYQYDPHSYATALLRLEQSRLSSLKLAVGAVSGKKQLLSRIKRITNDTVVSQQLNYGQKLIALLLVTGVICSIAWLSPADNRHVNKSATTTAHKELPVQPQTIPLIIKENLQKAIIDDISSSKTEKLSGEKKDIENVTARDLVNNVIDTLADAFENSDFTNQLKDGLFAANLKSPKFVFDEKKIKLPKSINLKDILPGNINFTIDLSKIDVNQLNQKLQEAYQQINDVDWKKVGGDIKQAFKQAKVSDSSLDRVNELIENAQGYLKLVDDKATRLKIRKLMEDQLKIQKEVRKEDSLLTEQQLHARINDTDAYNTRLNSFHRLPATREPGMIYVMNTPEEQPQNTVFISGNSSTATPYANAKSFATSSAGSMYKSRTTNSLRVTLNSSPGVHTKQTIIVDL